MSYGTVMYLFGTFCQVIAFKDGVSGVTIGLALAAYGIAMAVWFSR